MRRAFLALRLFPLCLLVVVVSCTAAQTANTPPKQNQAEVPTAPGRGKVRSVLLNANPEDTGSQTKRLRLTLGYAANLDKVRT